MWSAQAAFNLEAFLGFQGRLGVLLNNVLVAMTLICACIVLVEFIPYRGACVSGSLTEWWGPGSLQRCPPTTSPMLCCRGASGAAM